jgi:hypothetical protein
MKKARTEAGRIGLLDSASAVGSRGYASRERPRWLSIDCVRDEYERAGVWIARAQTEYTGEPMKRTFLAAAAALTLSAGAAQASAYVTGTWIGYDLSQSIGGANFVYSEPLGVPLQPGQTWSQTFDYSLTLHNDGLPAGRDWEDRCVGLPGPICAPAADGQEMAHVTFGAQITKEASGYFSYSIDGLPWGGDFDAAPGQTVSYSGTFTVTETVGPVVLDPFTQLDSLFLFAAAWVDSSSVSAVPEPSSTTLLLAGLVGLGIARRRH